MFMAELEEDSEQHDEFVLPPSVQMGERQKQEVKVLVDTSLTERLGEAAWLVERYLGIPGPKRNNMLESDC